MEKRSKIEIWNGSTVISFNSEVEIGLDSDGSIRQELQAPLVRTACFGPFLVGKPSSVAGSAIVGWLGPVVGGGDDSAAAVVRDHPVWNCSMAWVTQPAC